MKKINRNTGITLIALVVSIVVLLILTGISISMLTGQNGILTRAQEAKEKTSSSQKDEKNKMSQFEDLINESIDGIKVEQVEDEEPGRLEKEDERTYIINSIEDLVAMAYEVRSGENLYEGKTIKLGTNLDFNSTKSYVDAYRTDYSKYGYEGELKTLLTSGEGFLPIGTTSNINANLYSFKGTFQGNRKKLYNLYINKTQKNNEELRIGLFGNNYGVIQDVNIINGNITAKMNSSTCDIGGIVSKNYNTIENCAYIGNNSIYAEKDITGLCRIGGISSGNDGKITRCYSDGNIIVENNGEKATFIGGIASGNTAENSSIEECFTKGKIRVLNNRGSLDCGGITGTNTRTIKNCYNKRNIEFASKTQSNEKESGIGGIAGVSIFETNEGNINNCYNVGSIICNSSLETLHVGAIIGICASEIESCYCLKEDGITAIGENQSSVLTEVLIKTELEMKQDEFVSLLNINGDVWEKDENGINEGYPILKNVK